MFVFGGHGAEATPEHQYVNEPRLGSARSRIGPKQRWPDSTEADEAGIRLVMP